MAQLYWPYDPAVINEGYGWSDWRQGIHDGIDIAAVQGTPLRATASGTVRNVDAGRDGWGIDITTPDGWKVRHWHISRFDVPNGSYVEAGQHIGLTGGAPGTPGAGYSTGAHLHWGVQISGKWVDPATLNPIHFGSSPKPNKRKEEPKMMLCHKPQPDGSLLFLLFGDNFYLEFTGQDAANAFSAQIGAASAPVSQSFFDKVRAEVEAGRR